jgi:hypothetical protein
MDEEAAMPEAIRQLVLINGPIAVVPVELVQSLGQHAVRSSNGKRRSHG